MTTKFDIGQKVFLIHSNVVQEVTVNRIVISKDFIRYEVAEFSSISRGEHEVFATKADLLKSL